MARFILRFTGKGNAPDADLELLRASPQVKIVDDSSARMLLVEGIESDVRPLVEKMGGWILVPETFTKRPDPRVRIEKSGS